MVSFLPLNPAEVSMSSVLVSVSPLDPQISYSDDWLSIESQVGQKAAVIPFSFLTFSFFGDGVTFFGLLPMCNFTVLLNDNHVTGTKPSTEGIAINSTIWSPLFDIPGGTLPIKQHFLIINVTDASYAHPFVLTSIQYSTTPTPSNFAISASPSDLTATSQSTYNYQPTSSAVSSSGSNTRVLLEAVIGASAGAVALLCILAYVYLRYRRRLSLSCDSQRTQRNSAAITPFELHDRSTGHLSSTTSTGYGQASTLTGSIDKSKVTRGGNYRQQSFAPDSLRIQPDVTLHTESVDTGLRFQPASLPQDPHIATSGDPPLLVEDIGTIPISHWRDLEDKISVIGM